MKNKGNNFVTIRFKDAEIEMIDAAAADEFRTRTDFVRVSALKNCQKRVKNSKDGDGR